MEYVALGKSGLLVSKTAFGAMSLDCKEINAFGDKADELVCAFVRQAYEAGINFFDTSRLTPVSEQRLGSALKGIRSSIILATKSMAADVKTLYKDLNDSLKALETEHLDLFQLENSNFVPKKDSPDGLYNALLTMKQDGKINHIGFVTEDLDTARKAIESGLYETVQFPFNMIYTNAASDLVRLCADKDIGCIAMQPLNGGFVRDIPLAVGFFTQYENAVPVWGVHTSDELQQIIYFANNPPVIDEKFLSDIEKTRNFYN